MNMLVVRIVCEKEMDVAFASCLWSLIEVEKTEDRGWLFYVPFMQKMLPWMLALEPSTFQALGADAY